MGNPGRAAGIYLAIVSCTLSAMGFGTSLTLEQALETALAEHPDAAAARARVEEAEARHREVSARNLPRVDARISYLQSTNPMQGFGAVLSQGSFDNSLDFNDPGQLDALTATVESHYRIYSGGGQSARVKAADSMRAAGNWSREATDSGLEDAVVTAYFAIRQADQIVHSIESGLQVLKENLRISKIKESAGEMIRTERLNLEVQIASLQRDLLSSQHQAKLARFHLAYLLGKPIGTEINLADPDPSIAKIVPPTTLSIQNRPELLAARATAQAATHGIGEVKSGRLPTVDAYASWQADKGWRREGDGTSWTAGLILNVPIFDGASTRAQVSGARARERVALEQVRRLELTLQLELEESVLAHELALAQTKVATGQVLQAEEAAQLSRERFAAGTLLSTELIGVESRLIQAKVQLALAEAEERTALAHLRHVAGYQILN